MKQLMLFNQASSDSSVKKTSQWIVFIDGASRHNPGPAGAGILIRKNNEIAYQEGFYLGKRTNNQAEYLALLIALFFLRNNAHHDDHIHLMSDSELLVKQIHGVYKVRNEDLKPLHMYATVSLNCFPHGTISHVLREKNVEADRLANDGITKKQKLPHPFIVHMKHHGIFL